MAQVLSPISVSSLISLIPKTELLHLPSSHSTPEAEEELDPSSGVLHDGTRIKLSYHKGKLCALSLEEPSGQSGRSFVRDQNGDWVTRNGETAPYRDVARCYLFLEKYCFEKKDYEAAERFAREALNFTLRCAPERWKDIDIMDHCLAIAESLYSRGKIEQSLGEFRRGALLVERYALPGSLAGADYLRNVAAFLIHNGAGDSARWFQERGLENERLAVAPSQQARLDPIARVYSALSLLPENLSMDVSFDSFHLSARSLHGLFEALPLSVPSFMRDALKGITAIHLEKKKFQFEGRSRFFLLISESLPPAEILLDQVSFEIHASDEKAARLQLRNIRGLEVCAFGVRGKIEELSIVKTTTGLQLEFGRLLPIANPPDIGPRREGIQGLLAVKLPDLGALVDRKILENLPELPPQQLLMGEGTEAAHSILAGFIRYASFSRAKQRDGRRADEQLLAALNGVFSRGESVENLFRNTLVHLAPPEFHFLSELSSVRVQGKRFQLQFPGGVSERVGNLPFLLDSLVCFRLGGDRDSPRFEEIAGVSVRAPLPRFIRSALRKMDKEYTEIESLSSYAPAWEQLQKGASRVIQLTCSSRHISISALVDKQLEMLTEKGGQPQFSLFGNLEGNDRETLRFIEFCSGFQLKNPERQLFEGATAIWYHQGKLGVLRKNDDVVDMFGMRFSLDSILKCGIKVESGSLVISDIEGISFEALFRVPEFLGKLGIDVQESLSGRPTRLEITDADEQGNRVVVLHTTNNISRIALPIGSNGKPRMIGEHWSVFLTIRNPAQEGKTFSLTLRFKEDGTWDPDPQTLVRQLSAAAAQGAEDPVLNGFLQFAGFGGNLGIAGAKVIEGAERDARDAARAGQRIAREAANELDQLGNKVIQFVAKW